MSTEKPKLTRGMKIGWGIGELAIAVYVGVFSLSSVTRTFIEQGVFPVFPGMWTAYLCVAVALLFMLRQPRLHPR